MSETRPFRALGNHLHIEPALLALVFAGVALRAIQFFSESSLWVDEIALAHAVRGSTWTDVLLARLGERQIAPIGLVVLVKALQGMGIANDLTLRIPAFLASVVGLFLASILLKKLLGAPWHWVALCLLAFSPPLVHLSGILKQYSTDVFFSTALTLILLSVLSRPEKGSGGKAWICGLSVAFSSTAVFVCFAGFLALAARRPRWTMSRTAMASYAGGLLILPAILILHARAGVPTLTDDYMATFWQDAFMPPVLDYPTWLFGQLRTLVPELFWGLYILHRPWLLRLNWLWVPVLLLAGVGVLSRCRSRPEFVILLASPFLALLAASRLEAYPISQRTCLFLLPQLVVLMLWGFGYVLSRTPKVFQLGIAILVMAASLLPTALDPPPYRASHFGELVAEVSRHVREGDEFWIDFNASESWIYYARGFPTENVHIGRCLLGSPREQLRELAQFGGSHRVWVVFGWTPSFFSGETEVVLAFLRSSGIQRQEIRVGPNGSTAYRATLFDLGGSNFADPELFPLGEPVQAPGHFSCDLVKSADEADS